MREHVAWHIVAKADVGPSACGFCGMTNAACTTTLVKGAGNKKKAADIIDSTCTSSVKFSVGAVRTQIKGCSNHPMKCPTCLVGGVNQFVWKYGMAEHHGITHPGVDCPPEYKVDEYEVDWVKKRKKW